MKIHPYSRVFHGYGRKDGLSDCESRIKIELKTYFVVAIETQYFVQELCDRLRP
jgi:hypothetical protein